MVEVEIIEETREVYLMIDGNKVKIDKIDRIGLDSEIEKQYNRIHRNDHLLIIKYCLCFGKERIIASAKPYFSCIFTPFPPL